MASGQDHQWPTTINVTDTSSIITNKGSTGLVCNKPDIINIQTHNTISIQDSTITKPNTLTESRSFVLFLQPL
jgi:hypothetical protein